MDKTKEAKAPSKAAKQSSSQAAESPSSDLQKRAVCDGVGGTLGLEPPGTAELSRNLALVVASERVEDAVVAGELDLDLSSLSLACVPANIVKLAAWLQELDLSNCGLNSSDLYGLTQLKDLRALNLSRNNLVGVPSALGQLSPMLEELCVDDNAITQLPAQLSALTQLRWLSVGGNFNDSVAPECLAAWTELRYLDLRHNKLTALPDTIGNCTALEELHCGFNKLTSLPSTLGACKQLVALHAPNNSLTELPVELEGCGELLELDVTANNITELPPRFFQSTPHLLVLLAGGNKLTSVPPELASLTSLQVLSLAGNAGLKELPPELGSLVSVREVYLSGCPLTSLPDSVAQGWAPALQTIALRNSKLRGLPEGVEGWATCTLLDVRATAKGKKDSCRLPPETIARLAAGGCRLLGTLAGKAGKKKDKSGKGNGVK